MSSKVDTAKRIFKAFDEELSVAPLLEMITEDVEFTLTIEPGTPMSGTFKGRAGVEKYFGLMGEVMNQDAHEMLEYFESENGVAVLGKETFTVKKTGHVHKDSHWVTLFWFRGEKICKVLVVENTAPLWDAYR